MNDQLDTDPDGEDPCSKKSDDGAGEDDNTSDTEPAAAANGPVQATDQDDGMQISLISAGFEF